MPSTDIPRTQSNIDLIEDKLSTVSGQYAESLPEMRTRELQLTKLDDRIGPENVQDSDSNDSILNGTTTALSIDGISLDDCIENHISEIVHNDQVVSNYRTVGDNVSSALSQDFKASEEDVNSRLIFETVTGAATEDYESEKDHNSENQNRNDIPTLVSF